MKQQHAPEGAQQLSASAALLEAFDDAVLTTDLSGRIVVWNEAAAAVTGWLATIPQQREPVDPTPIPELTTVAVATAQVPEPLVGFLERDELTGLLGWRGLQRALRALSSADAESPCAVALADVDAFSLVNETYGYDVGDEVLRQGMHLLGGLVYGRPA